MRTALLRFELRALTRDTAFGIVAAVLTAAVVFGTINGVRWMSFQQNTLDMLKLEAAEKLATAKTEAATVRSGAKPVPRNWLGYPGDIRGFAYNRMEAYATKPPTPLAALTVGQSDLLPYYFKLNLNSRRGALSTYEPENPRRLLLGRFDLAFVVVFLLPLALIAVGYNVLATEREDGRLALLSVHGMTARRLALTRLALRAGILGAVVVCVTLLTLLFTRFDLTASGAAGAVLTWLTVAMVSGVFWVSATLLVSAIVRTSSGAALTLASLWLMLVVIVPWAINLVANVAHPLPSRTEYILAQRAASDVAEARRSELLGRYLQDHPDLGAEQSKVDATEYTVGNIVSTDYVETELRPIQARFNLQLVRQQSLIDRWQWFSPAVLVQQAFNELAGTGWSRHRAFLAQADAYLLKLRRYFHPPLMKGEFGFDGFDEWPRYLWSEPRPADSRVRLRWALAGLLLPTVVLGLAAFIALGRQRPAS